MSTLRPARAAVLGAFAASVMGAFVSSWMETAGWFWPLVSGVIASLCLAVDGFFLGGYFMGKAKRLRTAEVVRVRETQEGSPITEPPRAPRSRISFQNVHISDCAEYGVDVGPGVDLDFTDSSIKRSGKSGIHFHK